MSSAVFSTASASTALPGRPKTKSMPFSSHHAITCGRPPAFAGAGSMPVAANRDVGRGPMPADAADEPTQMAAHLLTGRRFARTQQYRYRPRHRRVIDMDRQKTALVVMGIEERELLVAVNHINSVINVERHRCGRGRIAGAIEIDHDTHQPDQVAQRGRILPARDGRLRAQIGTG